MKNKRQETILELIRENTVDTQELLQEMLDGRGIRSVLGAGIAKKGQVLLREGALPAGMEYPALEAALLTEGQIMNAAEKKYQ